MKPLALALLLIAAAACNNDNNPALVKGSESSPSSGKAKGSVTAPKLKYGIEGFYTGAFAAEQANDNGEALNYQITICIDSLNTGELYGHSVVAGNVRPFKGSYSKAKGVYEVEAAEPGNDKYDGVFQFTVDPKDKSIKGKWVANNKKVTVIERSYELKARPFKYDPSLALPEEVAGSMLYNSVSEDEEKAEFVTEDALKKNASLVLLKSKDVENMYKADLEVMRNAIYARHGYAFKNLRMRMLFDNTVEWYMPLTADVESQLTEIERKNIALLQRYEKHATKYYDYFGR